MRRPTWLSEVRRNRQRLEATTIRLVAFEEEIAVLFNAGKIRAPIHLYFGNEEAMIRVFRNIRAQRTVSYCATGTNGKRVGYITVG